MIYKISYDEFLHFKTSVLIFLLATVYTVSMNKNFLRTREIQTDIVDVYLKLFIQRSL